MLIRNELVLLVAFSLIVMCASAPRIVSNATVNELVKNYNVTKIAQLEESTARRTRSKEFDLNLDDKIGGLYDEEEEEDLEEELTKSDEGKGSSTDVKTKGGNKKKGKKGIGSKKKGMFEKFMPYFVIPFMVQSSMVPMVLATLKMMLLKSLFIGKLALILIALNAFRKNNQDTSYSYRRTEKTGTDLAMAHYGYNGGEEYGAYVNRRSSRYRR